MKYSIKYVFIIILYFLFFSCLPSKYMSDRKYDYHKVTAKVNIQTNKKIAVATLDQRNYVISGNKASNFVGLDRGGFGEPYSVETTSGRSLAQEFTEIIIRSLKIINIDSAAVKVEDSQKIDHVKAALIKAKSNRLILINLNEWKSDAGMSTSLVYNISLKVFDNSGSEIAHKSHVGCDTLRKYGHLGADRLVQVAFKEKIELLLNSEEISTALK